MSDHDELLRLRNRVHGDVVPLLQAHVLRIGLLDEWRERMEKRVSVLEDQVDGLERRELVRVVRFTVWQKLAGAAVVAVTVAGGIKGLLG